MADLRPPSPESDADEMTLWMADTGLLGERPGSEISSGSSSHRLFLMLLERDAPLSTDEAAEAVDLPAARAGRILERFRATGVVSAFRERTAWPPPFGRPWSPSMSAVVRIGCC